MGCVWVNAWRCVWHMWCATVYIGVPSMYVCVRCAQRIHTRMGAHMALTHTLVSPDISCPVRQPEDEHTRSDRPNDKDRPPDHVRWRGERKSGMFGGAARTPSSSWAVKSVEREGFMDLGR